jgi:hypothetical protein
MAGSAITFSGGLSTTMAAITAVGATIAYDRAAVDGPIWLEVKANGVWVPYTYRDGEGKAATHVLNRQNPVIHIGGPWILNSAEMRLNAKDVEGTTTGNVIMYP